MDHALGFSFGKEAFSPLLTEGVGMLGGIPAFDDLPLKGKVEDATDKRRVTIDRSVRETVFLELAL
ncbi:hypothetical protein [Azospirillum palustre]